MYKQYAKGCLYLAAFTGMTLYFFLAGFKAIAGFFTLGSIKPDPWTGTKGDNSVILLIMGIFAFIILVFFFLLHIASIKDVKRTAIVSNDL